MAFASGANGSHGACVRALLDVCFLLDLRLDRGGIGADLLQHVLDNLVLGRGPEQVCRVNVQAARLHRLLRGMLEQLAGGVAEVLRDVDLLGRAARARRGRVTSGAARRAAAGAPSPKKSEKNSSKKTPATERRPPLPRGSDLELWKGALRTVGDRSLFA